MNPVIVDELMMNKGITGGINFMSIAVSILTTKQVARNNGGVAQQESNPQSATHLLLWLARTYLQPDYAFPDLHD